MIEVKIIPFNTDEDNQSYLHEYFRLRKQVFMDKMGWDLFEAIGLELDEYDCHAATYAIAIDTETGSVLGGARLINTTREEYSSPVCEDPNSYMIRDAFLGRIQGIPSNICFEEPPIDPTVWELTRFVSIGQMRVGWRILEAVNSHLGTIGASKCLFLGPPTFMRMAKIMKFAPVPMGQLVANEHATFLAFSCDVHERQRPANEDRQPKAKEKLGAIPVAELFDVKLERVGVVYKWNTGEEKIAWSKGPRDDSEQTKFKRVEIPANCTVGPLSTFI